MAKTTYHKDLETILTNLQACHSKPNLLLHACCAPCSSYVLEYISNFFDTTILYYNPNIYPPQEYQRRLNELCTFLQKFPSALQNSVKFVQSNYDPQEFYKAIDIQNSPELATEAEKGQRCYLCYKLRLRHSYEYATQNSFDYFCTTLSISPFKDAQKINSIGYELQNSNLNGPKWLPSDFKKNSGFLRSLELSSEYNLYRQQYCGCVYSQKNSKR